MPTAQMKEIVGPAAAAGRGVAAFNVMSLVPMLVIFLAAQRYFIRSVAATGLAGT